MKSVLILTNSLSGGGAERSANLLANGLESAGHNVILIAINQGSQDLVSLTCNFFEINRENNSGIFQTLRAFKKFMRILKYIEFECVILNCELPELFGLFMRKSAKVFVVEHTTRPWKGKSFLGYMVRKLLSVRGAKFVAVSNHSNIWPFPQKTFEVIKNPIWLPNIVNSTEDHFIRQDIRLVFVGRLNEFKRPDLFLEVCRLTSIPGLIIGDGPLRDHLMELSNEFRIEVEYKGFILNPWEFVNHSDILLVTSDFEGDGMSAIEAAYSGVKVILLNNLDLRRLGFPEQNYASDVSIMAEMCLRVASGEISLDLSKERLEYILLDRSLGVVTSSWSDLIEALD